MLTIYSNDINGVKNELTYGPIKIQNVGLGLISIYKFYVSKKIDRKLKLKFWKLYNFKNSKNHINEELS